MQVAAFAVAGALGGGGVSFAASPEAELKSLKVIVETVALSVNEIKSELRYTGKSIEKIEQTLEDHENRIRAQEACVCKER